MPPRSSSRGPSATGPRGPRGLDRHGDPVARHVGVDGGAEPVGVGVGGRERRGEVVAERGPPGRAHRAAGRAPRRPRRPASARPGRGCRPPARRSAAPRRAARRAACPPTATACPAGPSTSTLSRPAVAAGERLVPPDGQVHPPSGRGQLTRDLLPRRPRAHHEHRAGRQPVRVAVVARVQRRAPAAAPAARAARQVPGRDDHVARPSTGPPTSPAPNRPRRAAPRSTVTPLRTGAANDRA